MRMEMPNISSAELEIMQVLWKADKALKTQEICDLLGNNKWKYNTVGTMLTRLIEKNAVVSEKHNRIHYFTPTIDEKEYVKAQTKNLVAKLYHGSVKDLAVSLFQDENMTEDDIDDIRKMFDL